MRDTTQDDSAITQKAAEWFFTLPNADAREQAAFGAWLKQSPRHVEEFLLVTAGYRQLDSSGWPIASDLENLRAQLQAGVAPLPVPRPSSSTSPGKRNGSVWQRPWALAAAVAILTLGALLTMRLLSAGRYATAVGEIRSLELDDGSLIHLNTRSRVKVDFSTHARDIELLSGEAIFQVARNPTRPFRVHAGGAVIQALGTEFNVHRRAQELIVAVIEGAVRVSEEQPAGMPDAHVQTLAAGQEARVASNGKIIRVATADAVKATAWRERRLVFRGDRLAEVVAEFNRYNRTPQLRVDGERARDKPIAGIFDANDPESLVQFLAGVTDLQVARDASEIVIGDR